MRVSRKICKAMRRERRANPTAEMLLRQRAAETPEKRLQREQAEELYKQFHSKGATWAACVQAVKTDWVGSFKAKYAAKSR
jgi:hypothetical protein